MHLFGFNVSVTRDQKSQIANQKSLAADWLRGDDLDSPTSSVLTNAYQQVVWVYRAINILAEQVANIPFLFSMGDRGRENLIPSGPLHDFYARPHPHINRFQYWELRIIWLMLRGECFRIPIYENSSTSSSTLSHTLSSTLSGSARSSLSPSDGERARERGSTRGRRLSRILILDPAHFQHVVENHKLVGWRYTGPGVHTPLESQVFLPEEVWFEKLPNPFDFWRGMPPLLAADMATRTDFAASAFMRGLIENNADAGLIVRTDHQFDEQQREQVLAALRNRKRRAGVADRPLLLGGISEIIRPELSSADLQYLENRKFSRAEICAAFGVPEEVLSSSPATPPARSPKSRTWSSSPTTAQLMVQSKA